MRLHLLAVLVKYQWDRLQEQFLASIDQQQIKRFMSKKRRIDSFGLETEIVAAFSDFM